MVRTGREQSSLVDRLKAEFKYHPKKAVILGVLVLILTGLSVRVLVQPRGPARANAAIGPSARVPAPAAPEAAPTASKKRGAATSQPEIASKRVKPVLVRDLFTADGAYFPAHRRTKPVKVVQRVDDGLARQKAQERAIRAQAQALTLQSTMVGREPTAIVNGEVLGVGDVIDGFRVVQITTRSCTLEKMNLRILLEMAN